MNDTTTPPPGSGPRVTRDQVRDLSRLRRASDQRMLGGVCEGLSRHLDIDPLLIRVAFAALTVFGGAGVILYVVAWLTIPAEDSPQSWASDTFRQDPQRTMVAGLSIAAVVAAVTMFGAIGIASPNPGGILFVSAAALVLFAIFSRRSDVLTPRRATTSGEGTPQDTTAQDAAAAAPAVPTEDTAPPAQPGSSPDTGADADAVSEDETAAVADSRAEGETETRAWWQRDPDFAGPTGPGSAPPASTPPQGPGRRPRSHLFAVTMALIAITLGSLWILDETTLDDVPASVYPGTALGIIAVALIVGAWYGRSRLLILAGLVASLLTAAFAVIGDGPYGDLNYAPNSASQVRSSYDMGAGDMLVRLDDVADIEALDGRTIDIDAGVGLVQLVVPTSIDATIHAHVDGGEIRGPAFIDHSDHGSEQADLVPVDDADPNVTIDVELNYGQIRIERVTCPGTLVLEPGQTTREWIGDSHGLAACN